MSASEPGRVEHSLVAPVLFGAALAMMVSACSLLPAPPEPVDYDTAELVWFDSPPESVDYDDPESQPSAVPKGTPAPDADPQPGDVYLGDFTVAPTTKQKKSRIKVVSKQQAAAGVIPDVCALIPIEGFREFSGDPGAEAVELEPGEGCTLFGPLDLARIVVTVAPFSEALFEGAGFEYSATRAIAGDGVESSLRLVTAWPLPFGDAAIGWAQGSVLTVELYSRVAGQESEQKTEYLTDIAIRAFSEVARW